MTYNGGGVCALCLEPLAASGAGALSLPCGHAVGAACLLELLQDDPLPSWRCPCCRATVDPAAVTPAAELPPEGRGLEFFKPQPTAGRCSSTGGGAGGSGGSGGSGGARRPSSAADGRLVGVERFAAAAARALADAGGSSCAGCSSTGSSSSNQADEAAPCDVIVPVKPPPPAEASAPVGWALLRAAERLLPEPALEAAATGLASLRLRQLLRPKQRASVARALGAWAAGIAALATGAAFGLLLLSRFMAYGLVAICWAHGWSARAMGMPAAPEHTCAQAAAAIGAEHMRWLVLLLAGSAVVLASDAAHRHAPHGGMTAYLLRPEAHSLRVLRWLYTAAFALGASFLLASLLINLLSLAVTAAWQPPVPLPQHIYLAAPAVDVGPSSAVYSSAAGTAATGGTTWQHVPGAHP